MKIQIYTKEAVEKLEKLEIDAYNRHRVEQQIAIFRSVIPPYIGCLRQAHNHTWDHDLCNTIIDILIELCAPIEHTTMILALKTLISKVKILASNCDEEYRQILMLMRSNFVSFLVELECASKNFQRRD